jgi:hypothetical protein
MERCEYKLYPDKYAVEEAFQLLKIPWEWYDSSEEYDVVIGRREDLKLVIYYEYKDGKKE